MLSVLLSHFGVFFRRQGKTVFLRLVLGCCVVVLGFFSALPVFAGSSSWKEKSGAALLSEEALAIVKLGKRGGDLTPVTKKFFSHDNKSFIKAIQDWNDHKWKEGVLGFKRHLEEYPDSPWAGEAELHVGCYYRYTGKLEDAEAQFVRCIERYAGTRIEHKAIKRLAGVYYYQGNYEKALQTFDKLLATKGVSWQELKYALHWHRHLKRIWADDNKQARLNQCGLLALGFLYQNIGLSQRAAFFETLARENTEQSSLGDLLAWVNQDFPDAAAVWADTVVLSQVEKPCLAYVDPGHFVVVQEVNEGQVRFYDPYDGEKQVSAGVFSEMWDGRLLTLANGELRGGVLLTDAELAQARGGCCGHPVPEPGIGQNPDQPVDPPRECTEGAPKYFINLVNLNMMVEDTPLFYTPPKGPAVRVKLTYNAGDGAAPGYFGNSWSFNYDTHYIVNPSDSETVPDILLVRSDGRRDLFLFETPEEGITVVDGRSPDTPHSYFENIFSTVQWGSYTAPPGVYDLLFPEWEAGAGQEPSQLQGVSLVLDKEKLIYHYNAEQNLDYIEDQWGNRLSFFYDLNGKLDYMTDAIGQITDFVVDPEGRITKVVDPFGRHADFEYDTVGNLVAITDMAGFKSTFTYSENEEMDPGVTLEGVFNVASITTPLSTTFFEYNYPTGYYQIVVSDLAGGVTEYRWTTVSNKYEVRVTKGIVNSSPGYVSNDERIAGISTIYRSDVEGRISSIFEESDETLGGIYLWDGESYVMTTSYDYGPIGSFTVAGFFQNLKKSLGEYVGSFSAREAFAAAYENPPAPLPDVGVRLTALYSVSHDNEFQRFFYDRRGNLSKVQDFNGSETLFQYDLRRNLLYEQNPEGHYTRYTYGAKNELRSIIRDRTNDVEDLVTTFTYTPYGNLETITNPVNKITTMIYDVNGYLSSVVGADNHPLSMTYDSKGRLRTLKDSANTTLAVYTYDDLNRLVRTDYPDGTFEERSFVCCRLDSVTDRGGKVTSYGYDSAGRLTTITDAAGQQIRHGYDSQGRLTEVVDQNGNTTSYTLNSLGWVTRVTREEEVITSFVYDVRGRVVARKDGEEHQTAYAYDGNSNIVRVDYPEGDCIAYTYYDDGMLHTVTTPEGITTLVYDDVNRLISIDGPGADDEVVYVYDKLSSVVGMTVPSYGTTEYVFDYNLGRLVEINGPDSISVSFTYTSDPLRQLQSIRYPNGTMVEYKYDIQHRLTDVINRSPAGTVFSSFNYTYNNGQRWGAMAMGNGFRSVYGYDDIYQLLNETVYDPGGSPIRSDVYGYDPAGNRPIFTRNGISIAAGHNSKNQLTWQAATPGPGGQVISLAGKVTDNLSPIASLTINGMPATLDGDGNYSMDVTLQQGENVFTVIAKDMAGNVSATRRKVYSGVDAAWLYDLNGNISTKQDYANTIAESFTHNSRNQLSRYEKRVGAVLETSASYVYDPFGRRSKKTVDGVEINFVYDREDVILEYGNGGEVLAKYIHGPRVDMPLVMHRGDQNYFYHFNGLGSVVALTDADGVVVQEYEYDAYGYILNQKNANFENRYMFTARELDDESGLYYYRARYYDASVGRFLQEDPIGMAGGINLYPYVQNDPVNFVDPMGLRRFNNYRYDQVVNCVKQLDRDISSGECPDKAKNNFRDCIEKFKNQTDLNRDGKIDGWDDLLWFSGRRLWDLNTPPLSPYPPGYGDNGPGSTDSIIPQGKRIY